MVRKDYLNVNDGGHRILFKFKDQGMELRVPTEYINAEICDEMCDPVFLPETSRIPGRLKIVAKKSFPRPVLMRKPQEKVTFGFSTEVRWLLASTSATSRTKGAVPSKNDASEDMPATADPALG
eukprot:TRINITY_DN9414_c0_g1::TRINITY_DN9414_c0_g1_i1::g.207::m.207 TRINITY_DN9414_c0_g1::TRINITY_DN9414_c0_g1_i1::g.207  ORF type:complete len:124 (+),score=6.70 TRINITY_DN9414_c0_g1_i1:316-687(+)